MLEFQRRQSEQFTLIVFTQVNSRPTISFYNLVVVPFIYWFMLMGIYNLQYDFLLLIG